ncbi:MAG: hypothetical protein HYY00_04520 [Chloroflexi bacterium]|nr:hypothetical protein [Chloroflexota bacterium]
MADMNAVKFELPVHIVKYLGKGDIGKACEGIWKIADQLSVTESEEYEVKEELELLKRKYYPSPNTVPEDVSDLNVAIQVLKYRRERRQYYLENMMRLLELHIQSREKPGK